MWGTSHVAKSGAKKKLIELENYLQFQTAAGSLLAKTGS
jgi:hypothetical protein